MLDLGIIVVVFIAMYICLTNYRLCAGLYNLFSFSLSVLLLLIVFFLLFFWFACEYVFSLHFVNYYKT